MYGKGCAGSTASGVSTGKICCRNSVASRACSLPVSSAQRMTWMPSSASCGATSFWKQAACRAMSSRDRVSIRSSTSRGWRPEAARVATPVAIRRLRPATRTMKNSSRLLANIARKFARSRSGVVGSSASSSTRSLNASQLRSRSRKRPWGSFLAELLAGRVQARRFRFQVGHDPRAEGAVGAVAGPQQGLGRHTRVIRLGHGLRALLRSRRTCPAGGPLEAAVSRHSIVPSARGFRQVGRGSGGRGGVRHSAILARPIEPGVTTGWTRGFARAACPRPAARGGSRPHHPCGASRISALRPPAG